MPTIVDPDNLFDTVVDSAGASIFIDTALRTIKIRNNSAAPAGPTLDETGVTLQCLYSFLKEEWKDDPKSKDLIAYPFPLIAITPEQFEWRYGWSPADDSSRSLIRTAGWQEYGVDNSTLKRQYIGTISLGNIDGDQNQDGAGDQDTVYYAFFDSADGTSTAGPFNYDFPGEVNQAVQIYDSADTTKDFRGDILRLFIRQPLKTYDQTDTTDIGLSAGTQLGYNTQRFPLVEGQDLKLLVANGGVLDATIAANKGTNEKYNEETGPQITYLSSSVLSSTLGYAEDLLNPARPFGITIRSLNGTGSGSLTGLELYSWVQRQLRQDSDIEYEAGTAKIGRLQDELLAYVGDTLTTKRATNTDRYATDPNFLKTGTAIINIAPSDINITQLRDDSDVLQRFPFSTSIAISFSQDILDDGADASVFVFYDHTRAYSIGDEIATSIEIRDVGASGVQDSANFILSGTSFTPVNSVANSEGLNPSVDADAYFRTVLAAGTGANHNVIWKITANYDSDNFGAITIDDTQAPIDQTLNTSGDAIQLHPINSPGALLLDSAGTSSENLVAEAAKGSLASGNLDGSNRFVFSYAFDNNTQKDRLKSADFVVNVRALGLGSGQWVQTTSTITNVNTNTISVVSPVERNYNNPA